MFELEGNPAFFWFHFDRALKGCTNVHMITYLPCAWTASAQFSATFHFGVRM